jgi:hypothetical protein
MALPSILVPVILFLMVEYGLRASSSNCCRLDGRATNLVVAGNVQRVRDNDDESPR